MIRFTTSGSFDRTNQFLDRIIDGDILVGLVRGAQAGVDALKAATPVETGLTAASWSYEIETKGGQTTIWWLNTHVVEGFNVAVGLRYGHGTGTGGWVPGVDFISPAMQSIFEEIADRVWEEVRRA